MRRRIAEKHNPFLSGGVGGATFGTLTAEAANARTQSVQLTDENGKDVNFIAVVRMFLSLDAAGTDVVAVAATSLLAGTDGSVVSAEVTGKVTTFQSEADGDVDVVITDAAVRSVYLCVQLPNGKLVVSGAIAFA